MILLSGVRNGRFRDTNPSSNAQVHCSQCIRLVRVHKFPFLEVTPTSAAADPSVRETSLKGVRGAMEQRTHISGPIKPSFCRTSSLRLGRSTMGQFRYEQLVC